VGVAAAGALHAKEGWEEREEGDVKRDKICVCRSRSNWRCISIKKVGAARMG
jgi:hypothetical protein